MTEAKAGQEQLSKSALHQQNQITWQHINASKFVVYNGLFHLLSDLVLYPPDVVRTRMQVQVLVRFACRIGLEAQAPKPNTATKRCCSLYFCYGLEFITTYTNAMSQYYAFHNSNCLQSPGAGNQLALFPVYTSTWNGFVSIIKHEGIRGIYPRSSAFFFFPFFLLSSRLSPTDMSQVCTKAFWWRK